MAGFVLTAQIQLQAPKNLSTVVNQIRSQLAGVSVPVNVTVPASASTRIAAVSKSLSGVTGQAQTATTGMQSFGKAAALAAKRFAGFTLATSVFIAFVRAMKTGVVEAISFEKEMVKISQITGKSVGGLKELSSEVTSLSKEFGVAAGEILQVSRVLAQAGLSAGEVTTAMRALTKTELASTFGNIATTAEGAIAILRQFGRGVEALEGQLSAINAVSKSFAVESEDIIKAVRRTGGVFQAAGGDLNEFIALFTSVRATTRETAETIATGLRTIFTRIQRPQTIEFLKQFGVELQDLSGNFVGPFEAVKRLSTALSGLPKTSVLFAAIAEQLGGFRQIGKVIPLLQQFETSERALGKAMTGTNSLTSDAAKAQRTMAVQIAKVREEFGELTRKIADSRSFRTMVDIALKLSSAFIKVVDSLTPLIPLIATLGAIKLGGALAGFAKGFRMGIPEFQKGGMVKQFARGGVVPGTGNTDTVPAMLTPGEFVIKKSSVKSIGSDRLHKMNKRGRGGPIRRGRGGGMGRRRYEDGGETGFDWDNVTVAQLKPSIGEQRAQKVVKQSTAQFRKRSYEKALKAAGPKKKQTEQIIKVETGGNVGGLYINETSDATGEPHQYKGGLSKVVQGAGKKAKALDEYSKWIYPKGNVSVVGEARSFNWKKSGRDAFKQQVIARNKQNIAEFAREQGAQGNVDADVELAMQEGANVTSGVMGEAAMRAIAGQPRKETGGKFEFTGEHKGNKKWSRVIEDGLLSKFYNTKYIDIKDNRNKDTMASILAKGINAGFTYMKRGGKIQRLQDGGGVKGGHYAVSSDSAAFKSWTDVQSFIQEIKASGNRPKINFVAGPSGSGKSFATRGLSTITNRADAAKNADAFTFEFGGSKFENIADLVRQAQFSGGEGYWIEATDETVQSQRAGRLAAHEPSARDARPLGQMKGASKRAVLPSDPKTVGLLAQLEAAFPKLQKSPSADVELLKDGGEAGQGLPQSTVPRGEMSSIPKDKRPYISTKLVKTAAAALSAAEESERLRQGEPPPDVHGITAFFRANGVMPRGMTERPANWPEIGEEFLKIRGIVQTQDPYKGFHIRKTDAIKQQYRGQGWGSAGYATLAQMMSARGFPGFYSDGSTSPEASMVWDNLAKHYPDIFPNGIELLNPDSLDRLKGIREEKARGQTAAVREGKFKGMAGYYGDPVFGADLKGLHGGGKVPGANLTIKDAVGMLAPSGTSSEGMEEGFSFKTGESPLSLKMPQSEGGGFQEIPVGGRMAALGKAIKNLFSKENLKVRDRKPGSSEKLGDKLQRYQGTKKLPVDSAANSGVVASHIGLRARIDADRLMGPEEIPTSRLLDSVTNQFYSDGSPIGKDETDTRDKIRNKFLAGIKEGGGIGKAFGKTGLNLLADDFANRNRVKALLTKSQKTETTTGQMNTVVSEAMGAALENLITLALGKDYESLKSLFEGQEDSDFFDFKLSTDHQKILKPMVQTPGHVLTGSKEAFSDAKPNLGDEEKKSVVGKAFNQNLPMDGTFQGAVDAAWKHVE